MPTRRPRPRSGESAADPGRQAWVEVDLGAVRCNLRHLRERTSARILGQVKGDAYGHGAVEVARCLDAEGIDRLGVAFVDEAVGLRRAGVETPILLLAPIRPEQRDLVRALRADPTVSSLDQLAMWAELDVAARVAVHLKVNTGMNRLGIAPAELASALETIRRSPHLELAGLLTHFSDSEVLEGGEAERQLETYDSLLELLGAEERERCVLHLANSAATLHRSRSHRDLVRVGGALYGVDLAHFHDPRVPALLDPAMSVRAEIVQLQDVATGGTVGYGGRWVARRASRIAILPLGYADGVCSRLSTGGSALVRGRRAPLAGAVSMDYVALDVTDSGTELGDTAVLLGRQGDEEIRVEELARVAGTGPYEVLCRFGLRLERRYL